MLTQRYGLYLITFGLTVLLFAAGLMITRGFSLLLLFVAFNTLLVIGGGVWMWEAGKQAL